MGYVAGVVILMCLVAGNALVLILAQPDLLERLDKIRRDPALLLGYAKFTPYAVILAVFIVAIGGGVMVFGMIADIVVKPRLERVLGAPPRQPAEETPELPERYPTAGFRRAIAKRVNPNFISYVGKGSLERQYTLEIAYEALEETTGSVRRARSAR